MQETTHKRNSMHNFIVFISIHSVHWGINPLKNTPSLPSGQAPPPPPLNLQTVQASKQVSKLSF